VDDAEVKVTTVPSGVDHADPAVFGNKDGGAGKRRLDPPRVK
jgi:hypothetical protein